MICAVLLQNEAHIPLYFSTESRIFSRSRRMWSLWRTTIMLFVWCLCKCRSCADWVSERCAAVQVGDVSRVLLAQRWFAVCRSCRQLSHCDFNLLMLCITLQMANVVEECLQCWTRTNTTSSLVTSLKRLRSNAADSEHLSCRVIRTARLLYTAQATTSVTTYPFCLYLWKSKWFVLILCSRAKV